jgi:putative addiction module killer protein
MITIEQTQEFEKWFDEKRKKNTKVYFIIIKRLERLKIGNFGDYKDLKDNLFELRFFNKECSGLRVYFTKRENKIILLLSAGNKDSQQKDIQRAKLLIMQYC